MHSVNGVNASDAVGVVTLVRKIRGMKQADMAAAVGLTQPSYSRIETGKAEPSLSQFAAMLDAVGLKFVIATKGE